MIQPKHCITYREHKVCKLFNLLYGLKQAQKKWHKKFDHMLVQIDIELMIQINVYIILTHL